MAEWNPQANDLFLRAAEIAAPADRRLFLDQQCGTDAGLRAQVEALLAASAQAGSFLNKPVVPRPVANGATADYEPIAERPGTTIGPYKLMEQIGEGGMGLVFVAEQQHPVRRKVALKIIKPGMDSRDVIARFEAERQALALMEHPNIARVFDAGATESGRPFFVMELVKGIPIIDYCDQQQLTARERLDLFLSVCQAVQHAHGKGIIHRDLKPSNILVAPHDGVPVVKVIDFGVAKAIGQQLTDKTIYTRFTQMIGTPLYMSPEQAEINALDVDIRSDVYSLGVLLYELLTGTTPFDRQRFATAAYDEIRRIIREEEPPRPSTRLSTLGETLSVVSARRKTEPAKLSALVKGDLDWIVMKALEKDRTRRYETASAFAADVRRFLAEEPVEARPPSAWYRFRKFARRNRTAVFLTSFIAATVAAVLINHTVGLFQVRRARDEARAERDRAVQAEVDARRAAARAEAISEFLIWDLMIEVEPGRNPRDRPITLEEALNKVAGRMEAKFAGQPAEEAKLRHWFGVWYFRLGLYGQAEQQFRRAFDVRRQLLGADSWDTMDSLDRLMASLHFQGQLAEAEPLARRSLENAWRVYGPRHQFTLQVQNNLASLLLDQGNLAEAEPLLRDCLEGKRQVLGKEHADTLITEGNLAAVLHKSGRLEQAESLMRQNLATVHRVMGPDHPQRLPAVTNLARLLWDRGQIAEAKELYRGNLEAMYRVLGPEHPNTLSTLHAYVALLRSAGALPEAEPPLRDLLAVREKALSDDWRRFEAMILLGDCVASRQNYAEAEPLLRLGYEGMKQREAQVPVPDKKRLTEGLERLVQLYDAWGKPDEAAKWRQELEGRKKAEKQPRKP